MKKIKLVFVLLIINVLLIVPSCKRSDKNKPYFHHLTSIEYYNFNKHYNKKIFDVSVCYDCGIGRDYLTFTFYDKTALYVTFNDYDKVYVNYQTQIYIGDYNFSSYKNKKLTRVYFCDYYDCDYKTIFEFDDKSTIRLQYSKHYSDIYTP